MTTLKPENEAGNEAALYLCVELVIGAYNHSRNKRCIPIGEIGDIRHPQFNTSGDVGIGAIDIENGRVIRAQPNNLGDIAVIRQELDIARLQVQHVPLRGSLVGLEGVLRLREHRDILRSLCQ